MSPAPLVAGALRLARTLRWLKPAQLYGRLWRHLYQPTPCLEPAPPLAAPGVFQTPARRQPSLLCSDQVCLLNEIGRVDHPAAWSDPARSALWLYHLHYFDDLCATAPAERHAWQQTFRRRWLVENPPGRSPAWDPYPCSLRIVNWIKAHADPEGLSLDDEARQSLAVQLRWLEQRLEWHLLGNHLFSNAKALVFGGLAFTGVETEGWLRRGLAILDRELPEQVLADGAQFELSPMYHALAFEDLLDLLNAAGCWPGRVSNAQQRVWRDVAGRMARWLLALCHPDGGLAQFNDTALNLAPPASALLDYAARLGLDMGPQPDVGLLDLPHSGYVRATTGPAVLLADLAAIGPDYLPGHAHADTLSCELSLWGQRVLVNGGIDRYGRCAERLRQRGTAAHSTVIVDGEDSSEVWSGFRVARRARIVERRLESRGPGVLAFSAAHDGYRRLPGRVLHRRRWRICGQRLAIDDTLEGRFGRAQARWHLHPAVQVELEGEAVTALRLPDGRRIRLTGDALRVEPGVWCPGFGCRLPNRVLVGDFVSPVRHFELDWS